MIKKLFHFDNVLTIIFFSGMTMGLLAQWLVYPGKTYQIVGSFMMFIAMVVWTFSKEEGGEKNADR